MKKLSIAVFISGTGSNLKAIIEACKQPDFPVEVAVVLSNKVDAYGLNHAISNNIPTLIVDHKVFSNRKDFENEILTKINSYKIDLICLAGFMRVLSNYFFANWNKDIINIHPSLLPNFKGANAIKDALTAKAEETGCTIHYVIPEVDSGEIIVQRKVAILESDDFDSLKKKIHKEEHISYIEALKKLSKKHLKT